MLHEIETENVRRYSCYSNSSSSFRSSRTFSKVTALGDGLLAEIISNDSHRDTERDRSVLASVDLLICI